jgi:hypothetical protein
MFDWLFGVSCPVETDRKVWTERRFAWFVERFGAKRVLNARVILPTPEFFPDAYTGDEPSARRVYERVCGYMDVDPKSLELHVVDDEQMIGAVGLYDQRFGRVFVARAQLEDPTRLIATIAHEVAHDILLRGGHLTGDEPDHEHATDLLPAFFGIGIFAANGTLRETVSRIGPESWWSISIQGYLSGFEHGYALACFARARGERSPAWGKYLRADPRGCLDRALKFLKKTNDALIGPDGSEDCDTAARAEQWLASASPTRRLAALWDVAAGRHTAPNLLPLVIDCFHNSDSSVRDAAPRAVRAFADPSPALSALLDVVRGERPGSRAEAIRTLAALRAHPELVVPEVARVLRLNDLGARDAALRAVGSYGRAAEVTLPHVLDLLLRAVANSDDAIPLIVSALRAVCADPVAAVKARLGASDPELQPLVLRELKRPEAEPATWLSPFRFPHPPN